MLTVEFLSSVIIVFTAYLLPIEFKIVKNSVFAAGPVQRACCGRYSKWGSEFILNQSKWNFYAHSSECFNSIKIIVFAA